MNFNLNSIQEYDVPVQTERPESPTITVVVSSPVIQIIDVGETIRLPCTAYHNIRRVSYSTKITDLLFNKNGNHEDICRLSH